MDNSALTIVISLLTTIFGATNFFTFVAYRKEKRRGMQVETVSSEVTTLRATIDTMKSTVDWLNSRIDEMQKLIVSKDVYISELTKDKITLEIKNSKNKTAIHRALSCDYCNSTKTCPVLIQQREHDEEYLKRIENGGNSNGN